MMPDLRALFPAARLLPGKGATIRGFGTQKAIAGIQVSGVNGVLTLSRSDKSGSMPVMDTETGGVALRAGPGVRLHGYAGIHTLERLPVPPPEDPPTGPARLEWEVEVSAGYAVICAIGTSLLSPGNWVVGQETQQNTTLAGGWVDTVTASGIISAYGPGESPDACEELVYSSTFDPGTDYGDFVGSEFTETLVPFTDLIPPAIAALAPLSATEGAQEWPEASWQAVSEGTPYSAMLGSVAATSGADAPAQAISTRFRLRNRGGCAIRVDCGFYGSGISGGATDIATVIDLAPGAVSAWQEVPAIDPDPAKYYTAEIRRVRIGRWRTIA